MGNSRVAVAAAVAAALAVTMPGLAAASRQPHARGEMGSGSGRCLSRGLGPLPEPLPRPAPAADPRPYAAADTAFGLDALAAWCRRDPQANLVFSPESLATGMGMAYLGARGHAAAVMAHTFHLPPAAAVTASAGPAADRARSAFVAGMRGRSAALRALDGPGVAVLGSDHVWTDKGMRPEPSYLGDVAAAYGAGVSVVPLLTDVESARRTINATITRETGGQITDLFPAGSIHSDGWVLTDAMYLNALWARPFDSARTARGPFTTAAGKAVRPEFLHGIGVYSYAHADGWTAVSLPYRGGRLEMVALRPDSGRAACPAIGPAALNLVISPLAAQSVGLAMPKVRLASKADMAVLFGSLGMGTAFGPAADFSGLSPNAGGLSAVEHAATMGVNETGTVAAAATGTGIGVTAVLRHRNVVFDRPYLLLVRDSVTGEPLFLARVADPSQG